MAAMIHAAFDGRPVRAPGRDTTIDSSYVKDTALGYLRLLDQDQLPNWLYNISAGQVFSIGDMADAVAKAFPEAEIELGPGEWRGLDGTGDPFTPIRPASDITRAREDLGYEPQFDLGRAAADYAAWLREGVY